METTNEIRVEAVAAARQYLACDDASVWKGNVDVNYDLEGSGGHPQVAMWNRY